MLVRPAFLREATVSPHFDEAENRTTRHVLYSDWKEYLVVWRQNRVELYEDYVSLLLFVAFRFPRCIRRSSPAPFRTGDASRTPS